MHTGKSKFVTAIVGDGTFLFAVPSSVYWMSRRYNVPFLTIVLNNTGWNAPRKSAQLVHPAAYTASATNAELNISFDPSPDYVSLRALIQLGEADCVMTGWHCGGRCWWTDLGRDREDG
jgi:thiamine pyrophosphate-dependent acetolactate synthase large subunit-like protein